MLTLSYATIGIFVGLSDALGGLLTALNQGRVTKSMERFAGISTIWILVSVGEVIFQFGNAPRWLSSLYVFGAVISVVIGVYMAAKQIQNDEEVEEIVLPMWLSLSGTVLSLIYAAICFWVSTQAN